MEAAAGFARSRGVSIELEAAEAICVIAKRDGLERLPAIHRIGSSR
jgi:hypothetical protein